VTACAAGESAAADIESAAQRIESLGDMRGSVVPSAPPVAAGCIVTSGAVVNNEQFHPARRRVLPSAANLVTRARNFPCVANSHRAKKRVSRAVPGWFHPAPSSAYAQRGRVCPCAYRLAGKRAL